MALGKRRARTRLKGAAREAVLAEAARRFAAGDLNEAFDLYEQAADMDAAGAEFALAELYERYRSLGEVDRHTLYQSRLFDFEIRPGDRVLDVGSGNMPLRLATHLLDISLDKDHVGRAGQPFRMLEGREVHECSIERMPFPDKHFDFVYCSHVLEHVDDPAAACEELMRVGRRGYIETPTRCKDFMLGSARVSNHKWWVEAVEGRLVFTAYAPRDLDGIGGDLFMRMLSDPASVREKAFWALVHLRAERLDVMLLWEDRFAYEVRG